ncbi:MAG: helix-turn-helix transcriptional regulator [Oscillospiraceae bacterium]|nr:helix-turn-helix transcriptional regulator [Oscillospiraceae bacterium]
MTNAQILKDRIKNQCEKQEKSMTVMLSELSLGVNAVNQINEKKGMGAFTLSKIADYLNCSVDYLLGRTDKPNNFGDTYYGDNNGFQANRGTFNIGKTEEKTDNTTEEFIQAFKSMELPDRVEVMKFAFDRIKKDT